MSIAGLSALAAQARRLRERVAHTRAYGSLCAHIDSLMEDLQAAVRSLSQRAAAIGTAVPANDITSSQGGLSSFADCSAAPADLAAAFVTDCQACGTRLCELMQTAQAAQDTNSANVAYSLLRTLEKQLWLLRPHTMGSAHPFPFATA